MEAASAQVSATACVHIPSAGFSCKPIL
jgi:hypothetical protein